MVRIVFKSPAANGAQFHMYDGEIDSPVWLEYLETAKFLWVDETTFIAVDNIAYIMQEN